jgi:hypothetical protein
MSPKDIGLFTLSGLLGSFGDPVWIGRMSIQHVLIVLAVIIPPSICSADKYDDDPRVPKPIYPIRNWPQDIASVPCSAWKKDDLRAWALTGTLDWTGGDLQVWSPTYQLITPEGAIIEKKCATR